METQLLVPRPDKDGRFRWQLLLAAGLFVAFMISPELGLAAERVRVTYSFPKARTVEFIEEGDYLVSGECEKKAGAKFDCDAVRLAAKVSFRSIPKSRFRGGAESGAVLCSWHSKKLVVGRDHKKGEASFCVLEDGSMIGTSSLSAIAQDNDSTGTR